MATNRAAESKPRITILGIGNLLYQDEGQGVQILPLLRDAFRDQDDVEIIEGATDGMLLLEPVESAENLIVVDAIHAGKTPGELITLAAEEIPHYLGRKMSLHQAGFHEVLALAKFRERFPARIFMCGIEPESLKLGLELSETVRQKLPQLVSVIVEKVKEWRGSCES